MYSFSKNNKFILISIIVFIVILLTIIILMLSSTKRSSKPQNNPDVFADTSENRNTADMAEYEFLFGTSSERFIVKTETKKAPLFRALTNTPSAGAVAFEKTDSDGNISQFVRYISTKNGHVFDIPVDYVEKEDTASSKTILRILNVLFSKNATFAFVQYYDENNINISNYLENFDDFFYNDTDETSDSANTSGQIAGNIVASAFSPDGDKLFYLTKTQDGVYGFLKDLKSKDKTKIWSSPLTNFNILWNSPNKIIIYTKPTRIAQSVAWILNTKNNGTEPVIMGEYGLSLKIDSTGNKLLYSSQEERKGPLSLSVMDIKTKKITPMPIATIADKCVWGNDSSRYVYCAIPRNDMGTDFIEDWYMGLITTDDVLWRIDTETATTKKILDPYEETGEKFDIENIMLTPDSNYLIFNTRVNKILWALKLQNQEDEG